MEQTVEYAQATGLLGGVWLLVAIPLASAAILLLLGRRADRWGHWLGVRQRRRRVRARADLLLPAARPADEPQRLELSLWDFIRVGGLQRRLRAAVRPAGRRSSCC